MSDETPDPRKDSTYDTARSLSDTGSFGSILGVGLAILFAAPLILGPFLLGREDEQAKLVRIHSLPADAHAIVDRGHGWVEFSLTVGGQDHRYLRGRHFDGVLGSSEVLTEIRPAK